MAIIGIQVTNPINNTNDSTLKDGTNNMQINNPAALANGAKKTSCLEEIERLK